MNHNLRIGLVTPGWPGENTPNGIATSVYNLAMGLHQIGMTPVILSENFDGDAPSDFPCVKVRLLKWRWQEKLRSKFDGNASHLHIGRNFAVATQEAIDQYGIDALIMEETNGWVGTVKRQVSIPVFITLHGPWTLLKDVQSIEEQPSDTQRVKRESRAFEIVDGLISPSQNVLEAVEKSANLRDTPKTVLPNSFLVDPRISTSSQAHFDHILFVGRFDKLKGGDTVLAAFALLAQTHPNARLTFVGPDKGIERSDGSTTNIEQALNALPDNVRTMVTYKGPLPRDEVKALRETHSIALIASRYENLNYTLLEAMAAGQAIVCTEIGGPAEVLNDGVTALLVPPSDPTAMATALGTLLDDNAKREALGAAAQATLARDFSPAVVAKQTVDFINEALETDEN